MTGPGRGAEGLPAWLPRAAAAALVVWALGNVLAEGVAQAGAAAALLISLPLWAQKVPDARVRRFGWAAAALMLWQAISPAVALWRGVAGAWPKSGRYGQLLDTFAPAGAGAAASLGVPWVALAGVLGGGWVLSCAVGTYQHFVEWPFGQPAWLKTPVERVRESFDVGGPRRFAAGGLLFHRLRFAHGAIAVLGPALGLAGRRRGVSRALAVGLSLVLLAGIYMSFARAALLAAVVMGGISVVWLLRGPARWGVLVLALLLLAAVMGSPAWRMRLGRAEGNVAEGERHLAMSVGLELAREHPLLGVGFGNHKPAALATAPRTGINDFLANDSHDLWITTWAETGLLGVLLTVAYHALLVSGLWGRAREGSWVAAGALLSWGGFQLLSLVHYLPYHTGVYLSFGLLWGLGLAPSRAVPWAAGATPVHRAESER